MKAGHDGMQEEEDVVPTQVVGHSLATLAAIVDEDSSHVNGAEINHQRKITNFFKLIAPEEKK